MIWIEHRRSVNEVSDLEERLKKKLTPDWISQVECGSWQSTHPGILSSHLMKRLPARTPIPRVQDSNVNAWRSAPYLPPLKVFLLQLQAVGPSGPSDHFGDSVGYLLHGAFHSIHSRLFFTAAKERKKEKTTTTTRTAAAATFSR